jgi:apolipoprotein N-acyltransferase
MYGVGFLVFAIASCASAFWDHRLKRVAVWRLLVGLGLLALLAFLLEFDSAMRAYRPAPPLKIAGIQMEFPPANLLPKVLDQALAKNPNAALFVLSEYTLDGPVPAALKQWCRNHARYLIVGGKDELGASNYYNTAFVVGANGEVIFQPAKSVPIQFFKDGLPAPEQKVWESPWGRIGICVCYDLSYRRVTDGLIKQGAQLLIVPTMDVEDWGAHQHELHARVAWERAAEYGVPIFRVASSGISQAVNRGGYTLAQTRFSGSGDMLVAEFRLPSKGSLPLDTVGAPACVALAAMVLALLLMPIWQHSPEVIE